MIRKPHCSGHAVLSAAVAARDVGVMPLIYSPKLSFVAAPIARLANELYATEPLLRRIGGVDWRFRWLSEPVRQRGALLQLRIAGAQLRVIVDDLALFGVEDAVRDEIPASLRIAYLGVAGEALWREIEALTGRTVELMDMCRAAADGVAGGHVGFEIRREPQGPAVRGVLCFDDAAVMEILREASMREMRRASIAADFPVQWAAVIGSTNLPVSDVDTLMPEDMILVERGSFTADALGCWLYAGAERRKVGRASLQMGQLHVVGFADEGDESMNDCVTQQEHPREITPEEIQVTLRFELAQWRAALFEVAGLAPGSVIDTGQPIDEQTVTVWADQRRIATGHLVAVGDRLGVRLVTVFGTRAPDASSSSPDRPAWPASDQTSEAASMDDSVVRESA